MLIWHFDRIPDDLHADVVRAFQGNDIKALVEIYTQHKVSPLPICDTCGLLEIVQQTKKAIEQNIIRHDNYAT